MLEKTAKDKAAPIPLTVGNSWPAFQAGIARFSIRSTVGETEQRSAFRLRDARRYSLGGGEIGFAMPGTMGWLSAANPIEQALR